MKVNDLFEVKYGTNLELNSLDKTKKEVNFVSRTTKNNGISAKVAYIKDIKPISAGTISVALGGNGVLTCCVQPSEYYSGRDVAYLVPRKKMTIQEKLFYCVAIRMNKYKYSYGRQANRTLKSLEIPSFSKLPNWVKDKFVFKIYDKNPISNKEVDLVLQKWEYFDISKLFDVAGSQTTPLTTLKKFGAGRYPYVTTKSSNIGIEGFYDYFTEEGNILTIDSAVVGFCSYRESKFSASDHVEKLVPKFSLNGYIGIFLSTIINLEHFRYNYGRKFNQDRIKITKIKLPVDSKGEPDWQFMEDYIKSLPCSKALEN